MFFLHTDDFHRDHAAMLAAGVMFDEPVRHEPYGSVAVWRDPFGNRWDTPLNENGPHPAVRPDLVLVSPTYPRGRLRIMKVSKVYSATWFHRFASLR